MNGSGRVRRGIILGLGTWVWMVAVGMVDAATISSFGVGLRAGIAFVPQDVELGFTAESDPGVTAGLQVFFNPSDLFRLGLNADWQRHDLTADGFRYAEFTTLAIVPFIEWHPLASQRVSPYALLGVGYNMNTEELSVESERLCRDRTNAACDETVANTLALRAGGGLDLALNQRLILNAEVVWTRNTGRAEFELENLENTETRFNASRIAATVGARVAF